VPLESVDAVLPQSSFDMFGLAEARELEFVQLCRVGAAHQSLMALRI
jgi:hypothetical protein